MAGSEEARKRAERFTWKEGDLELVGNDLTGLPDDDEDDNDDEDVEEETERPG